MEFQVFYQNGRKTANFLDRIALSKDYCKILHPVKATGTISEKLARIKKNPDF